MPTEISTNNLDIFRLVIEYTDNDINSLFYKACSDGKNDIVKFLLGHDKIELTKLHDGWSVLHIACKYNRIDIIKIAFD